MRTETIKIYSFDELSKEIKIKAIAKHKETADYYWSNDAFKSLKAFLEYFGASLKNYEIAYHDYGDNYITIDCTKQDEFETETDYLNWIEKKLSGLGGYNDETLKGLGDCKLTGVCFDEDLIDGFRIAYMQTKETNLKNLLHRGYLNWLRVCKADYENQFSEAEYNEHCEGNDFEFTEDGDRYRK